MHLYVLWYVQEGRFQLHSTITLVQEQRRMGGLPDVIGRAGLFASGGVPTLVVVVAWGGYPQMSSSLLGGVQPPLIVVVIVEMWLTPVYPPHQITTTVAWGGVTPPSVAPVHTAMYP